MTQLGNATSKELYLSSVDALLPSIAFWVWVALHMKFMMLMQRHLPEEKSSYKLLENCLIHIIVVNAFEWFSLGMVVEQEQDFYGAKAMEYVLGPVYNVFVMLLTPPIALFRFHSVVTAYEMWKHISENKPEECRQGDGEKLENTEGEKHRRFPRRAVSDDPARNWINDRDCSWEGDVISDTEAGRGNRRQVRRLTYPFGPQCV